MKKYYQIKRNFKFLEEYNSYRAVNFNIHYYFHELSNDILHFDVAQNFIICICLSKVLTINFLEDGNRYKDEIFRVNKTFNDLSNDISFV